MAGPEPDRVQFAFTPCPELAGERPRHGVAVVGAGPVGLTAAADLALHGVQVVVIDGKLVEGDFFPRQIDRAGEGLGPLPYSPIPG